MTSVVTNLVNMVASSYVGNPPMMNQHSMRVVKLKTLKNFWELEPTAKTGLQLWYRKITGQRWETPNEIIINFTGADTVGNNRIVFNINRNDYRLIVTFRYKIQVCYVQFIGTHKAYDKIDDVSLI